jgi:SAM-dependent methyltransferase
MSLLAVIEILSLYIMFTVGFLYVVFGGFLYGAMWMPLPKRRVQKMLELANLTWDKTVYDLGAGYGNIAFKAALSGASVIAVEADPFKAWWIRRQIRIKGLSNVKLIKGNLLNVDLSNADVLVCYLSDGLMDKISEKNIKKNALIISCCHKIKNWSMIKRDKDNVYPIYVYEVNPAPILF